MNILLVEDDAGISDFIQRGLRSEGWTVVATESGETALNMVDEYDFDVVVLDLLLPGLSGRDVCKHMRAQKNHTPVLMLTALGRASERVAGLRAGADDYLAKPFDFDELVARIEALRRRASAFSYQQFRPVAAARSDIQLNRTSMTITSAGKTVETTATERELLQLFLNNPSRALSRERILNSVWGANSDPMTNVVDVYVARLRKKLTGSQASIRTVRGIGYQFDPK